MKALTPIRYSTARSALLKLARMARITLSLGNPISTMLSIAPCKFCPDRRSEEGPGSEVIRDEVVVSWVTSEEVAAGIVMGSV